MRSLVREGERTFGKTIENGSSEISLGCSSGFQEQERVSAVNEGFFETCGSIRAAEVDKGVCEGGVLLEVFTGVAGVHFTAMEVAGVQDQVWGRREFGEAEAKLGGELVLVSFEGGFDYG